MQRLREVSEKYDLWHIHVKHREPDMYLTGAVRSFGAVLPQGHMTVSSIGDLAEKLIGIITAHANEDNGIILRKEEKPAGVGRRLFGLFSW